MNEQAIADEQRSLSLQAGGTLNPRRHLYIERPDDANFLRLLSEGQYVNVLTSRQMGKSSLMVRTAEVLTKHGVRCAIVDLAAELGTPQDASAYFLGLLNKIARDLKIKIDLPTWWAERPDETMNQRLMRFFREVVLEQVPGPVVCFLDEIDSTLKLPWTDDLFTALRGMHNERPLVPSYERLTFCLIGVAWPNELIKDRRTTPYNVGSTLELRDFELGDNLTLLIDALGANSEQGRRLIERVLHWTGGHPYLTARLCAGLRESGAQAAEDVDRRVDDGFRSLERVSGDVHFQQVLRFLETRVADGLATFNLYEKTLKGARERDQPTPAHTELKLSGLVKRDEEGCLVVRNRIYERVFDRRWVESTKPRRALKAYRRYAIAASVALLMVGGTAAGLITWLGSELSERDRLAAADFRIVDCRLPPRIRRLGPQRVYLEPQRPIRTTGRDCGVLGGEAIISDATNDPTALAVWLPLAKEGDPKAQTYVGEIFERGLRGTPDYQAAADWYRRAADKGFASAQVSLGQLYERGLGVTQDLAKAIQLYRQASGLGESLRFVPIAQEDVDVASLPILPADFGKYYALVIGNSQYGEGLMPLGSAAADSQAIASMLKERYGHDVFTLIDADREQILDALHILGDELTYDDNLLIYYSGHGWLDTENDRGYWLPVDAKPYPHTTSWISTAEVTEIVNSMEAKQVLIICDSVYSAALTGGRPAVVELPVNYADWLRLMTNQPARLVIAWSGEKVLAAGTGLHSVLAAVLLETLGTNLEILAATRLFIKVAAGISDATRQFSGHAALRLINPMMSEGGEFFFVPAVDSLGLAEMNRELPERGNRPVETPSP